MKKCIKTPKFMGNSLKIASAIVLFMGASLIIPKIAGAAGTLNHMVSEKPINGEKNSVNELNLDSKDSFNGYEPPDFGRPQSAYGSGTR